jgi:hypothetical protein
MSHHVFRSNQHGVMASTISSAKRLSFRGSSYTPISAIWGISLLLSSRSRTLCHETRGIRRIVVGGVSPAKQRRISILQLHLTLDNLVRRPVWFQSDTKMFA